MTVQHRQGVTALALAMALAGPAAAVQVTQLSPQGEVAKVRQVVAQFDTAAIQFGSQNQPAPLQLSCSDSAAGAGHGRWTSERSWVYDFNELLPPGVSCAVQVAPGFRGTDGKALTGPQRFAFQTGGPVVRQAVPADGATIEEGQFFLLRFNGAVAPESVKAHAHCTMDGLGERIAVRLITGDERDQLVQARGWNRTDVPPAQVVALACQRQLTPSAQVRLVLDKGVATPGGAATRQAQRLAYTVREPLRVSFSCERENAQSACLPLRPMALQFNAPVTARLALAIRLQPAGGGEAIAPKRDDGTGDDDALESVAFAPTLAEKAAYTVVLPKGFADASGRAPANAAQFPLKVATGPMPPLVKFAAAPFGVVERLAEPGGTALLPVTVRNVERELKALGLRAGSGQVRDLQLVSDADIVAWYQRVARFNDREVPRTLAGQWARNPLPRVVDKDNKDWVESRMLSLLQGLPQTRPVALPQAAEGDPRPMEVVGIPLQPGFHVLEIASPRLGKTLLDERHGAQRTMHVRTSALVTNLGVHFKRGQENALAWVTTLDKGRPVAGAAVQVSDCKGRVVTRGQTDASGVVRLDGVPPQAPRCELGRDGADEEDSGAGAWFVSARATGADGVADLAFTWSDWNRGIEAWRFDLPTGDTGRSTLRAHTVLDRALLRAGETLSMKHFVRIESLKGFRLPEARTAELIITHQGSGQEFRQPVAWRKTPTGGLSATSNWAVPPAARLGLYTVQLAQDTGPQGTEIVESAQFRVEEFRLPVLNGQLTANDKKPLIGATRTAVDLQVNYVSGGGAANLATQVSALLRPKVLVFPDHEGFSFEPPREARPARDEDDGETGGAQKLVADKLPLALDRNGRGRTTVNDLPALKSPQQLLIEASYADPNGETQTLRHVTTLWPAAVVAGIKTEGWVSTRQRARFQALALGIDGQPAAGVRLDVKATLHTTTSTRKRMVGGFYSYDNQSSSKALGTVCSGSSDARGLLLCEAELQDAGEVELTVTAQDKDGRQHQSAASVYVTRQGELWFGGEDHDRMDVVPEKKRYQPGETARLQVRMPFRFATALVSIEREGILDTKVVQLNGEDPTIELKVGADWGPNVYVSVMALRGRLREVPWYSFFTWGYQAPREWWTAFWYEGREYVAPTALVDLSKPAYRLGVTELQVGVAAHEIQVAVSTDRESYPVRGQAQVNIQATLPDGRPAANAEVALAVVDQALLELGPNTSWDLLAGLWQRRGWSVETATAQMEIIGRRHYGRKAMPAGGGGGHSPTRELFDTLLLWKPNVVLDAQGRARVTVPLNDAISSFQVVAVADAGTGQFGTGKAQLRTTQDLQIISGLPPLVREGDQFVAQFSLRNTTAKAMQVAVTARATLLETPPQTVAIAAGETREVSWPVTAPVPLGQSRQEVLLWEVQAQDTAGGTTGARDALKASQRTVPAVPVTVQQATLAQLDGPLTVPVAPPAGAQADPQGLLRGGVRMSLQPTLAEGLPAVREWFANYPFACLEQKTSRAIGLRDAALWQTVVAQLPVYLDADGLASYFPPRDGEAAAGSDTLSAYLLATTHEAASLDPAWALPAESRDALLRGLEGFVQGRVERQFWSPRQDLTVRKLAAIEALSRYGKASARQLQSIEIAPNQWPTHAVIDWLNVLNRVTDVPKRAERLQEANQILRARLSYQGTKLVFSTEADDQWWWLMQNSDVNTARLLLAVMNDPAWKDDMGRIASGFIGRQQRGTWATTTANLWGGLALQKFSARFEAVPVAGSTRATLGTATAVVDWSKVVRADTQAPVAAGFATVGPTTASANTAAGPWKHNSATLPWSTGPLAVTHAGSGKPWVTLQSLAAIDPKAPQFAGYQVKKTITPVEQAVAGRYSRGDILRITLEVTASTDMTWVVLTDPVPAGASILGSGLGRDSAIATTGEQRSGNGWPVFEERSFEAFRAYYDHLGAGRFKTEYTVRLNNAGTFALPPTRIQAMYAPEVFGELPNARLTVGPRP